MARARGIKKPHPLGSVASRSGVAQFTAANGFTAADGVKISELPVAEAANDTDQFEVNQGGVSRRVTVGQLAAAVALLDITSTPEDFGAVGDGSTPDDAAITAWLAFCTANNVKAVGTPGKSYLLSANSTFSIRTEFDGNGSEFITSSVGVVTVPVFRIESLAADIETVPLATVNAWTGLYRWSRQIPQLAGAQGWSYAFETTDEPVIQRAQLPHLPNKGEAFEVGGNGFLSKTIVGTYTMPFAQVTARRQRIRQRMHVKGLILRLTAANYNRELAIIVERPHTTLEGCKITNETVFPVDRGFTSYWTTSTAYESCRAENFEPTGTGSGQYGFDSFHSDDITIRNCSTSGCRRGVDAINSSNYRIDGGSFPEGIGGHWIEGLHVYGNAFISCEHPNNNYPIQVAGSDINIESARIHVPPYSPGVLRARGDYPELRGICRIGPDVDIAIDDTGGTPGNTKAIMNFPLSDYDSLRDVALPTIIDCLPGRIRQIGGLSPNAIALISMPEKTAAQFPRNIVMPAEINIEPGSLLLDGGYGISGSPRMVVFLARSENVIGASPCRVRIDRIRRLQVGSDIATPAKTGPSFPGGRYDVEIRGVTEGPGTISLQRGAVRRIQLERVDSTISLITTGEGGTAVGDEDTWDTIRTYTPTYTLTANITTHTPGPVHYEYTNVGQKRHVQVWGAVTLTPTAAGSTATNLGISLPFPATLVAGCLAGNANTAAGNLVVIAGIAADTANGRAILQFLSTTTSSVTLYYSFNYIF